MVTGIYYHPNETPYFISAVGFQAQKDLLNKHVQETMVNNNKSSGYWETMFSAESLM